MKWLVGGHAIRPGHILRFKKPRWEPWSQASKQRYRRAGYTTVIGVVESSSYGPTTGQHTFCVRDASGQLHRVKGRNIYGTVEFRCLGGVPLRLDANGHFRAEDDADDHAAVKLSKERIKECLQEVTS